MTLNTEPKAVQPSAAASGGRQVRDLILAMVLVFTTTVLAHARIMPGWSYQKLYDQADLVAIARPVSTQKTAERTTLPDIAPDVHVVGCSTEFEIRVVMKGDKSAKKVTLHHYSLADPQELMMNGPSLAYFNPKSNARFLLFLRREADGRYAPVSGQTDPAMHSVLQLGGSAE